MATMRYTTIPKASQFAEGDWLPADDIGEIGDRLIQTREEFAHLRDMTIMWFWKKKGGTKDGLAILGMCRRVTGPLKAVAPGADFMIYMSADQWELNAIDTYQAEAITYHELLHAGVKEGKPVIIPHDIIGFRREVTEYGLYSRMLQAAGETFQQLALQTS